MQHQIRLLCIALFAASTFSVAADEEEREFKLEKDYFNWLAKRLDYYPFTTDLKKIDDGVSGEYSYCWSIGWPQPRHVIQAACLIDEDKVLLSWWRSKDRETRVVALAVFHCTRVVDFGTFPKFEKGVERFKPEEAKERKEELEFVRTHSAFFRKWFSDLTSDTLPKDCKFLKSLKTPRKL